MNTIENYEGFRVIGEAPLYAVNMNARVIRIETGQPVKPNAARRVRLTVGKKQTRPSVNALRARAFPAELLAAATLAGEQWRVCPAFPDYKVSTHARVWSVKKAIILNPGIGTNGYPSVTLPLADGFPSISVHKLVADAFLGPCPEGMHVAHIDRDSANARLSNLRHVRAFAPTIDQAAAVTLYLAGASGRAAAKAIGCEMHAVYRALRANGIKPRPPGRPASPVAAQQSAG
jgi:hypothetical protein